MELGTLGTFGFALSSPHCIFMLSSIINSWLNNSLYVSQREASNYGYVQSRASSEAERPHSLDPSTLARGRRQEHIHGE